MSLSTLFDELFAGVTVSIDTDRCLNTRHDRAGCSRCVDVCPSEAIHFDGRLPSATDDLCVGCGACLPACPTDAIHGSDLAERHLLEVGELLDNSAVTVACALNPRPQPGSPSDRVVRHGRCLAAIPADQLLALTRTGTRRVTLDLSWCDRCPIGTAGDAAITAAGTAATLLELFEAPQTIAIVGVPGIEQLGTESGPVNGVLDAQRAPLTRRGMFTTLRRRVETATERAATPPAPPMRRTRGPVPRRLPHNLPASRRRLLEQLAALRDRGVTLNGVGRDLDTTMIPIRPVLIDSNACSACGLCARYCPTGALTFTTDPSDARVPHEFTLTFRPEHCIDCDICAVACPEGAVTSGNRLGGEALIRPHPTVAAAGPLAACGSCGAPTAVVGSVPARCFSCRLGTGVVTALRDEAGLMADLMGRLPSSPGG